MSKTAPTKLTCDLLNTELSGYLSLAFDIQDHSCFQM